MTMRIAAIVLIAAALGGCSGKYILTVPDQVAPADGHAPAVVRLQQYEFGSLRRRIEDALLRFSVASLTEKGAFTDELGFAAMAAAVPAKPGKYELLVQMQNAAGDEVAAKAPVYVWAKDSEIVAIDADSLPMSDVGETSLTRKALSRIAVDAHIIYLTRRHAEDVHLVRDALQNARMPDGPVLVWRQSYWHLVRTGRLRMPKLVYEAHLVSDLSLLREIFSGLKIGISSSRSAIEAFSAAGMSPLVVGGARSKYSSQIQGASWSSLAANGLGK